MKRAGNRLNKVSSTAESVTSSLRRSKKPNSGNGGTSGGGTRQAIAKAKSGALKRKAGVNACEDLWGRLEELAVGRGRRRVSEPRFQATQRFVQACHALGQHSLRETGISGDAGYYLGEVLKEIVVAVRELVEGGDVMLARQLQPAFSECKEAMDFYGKSFCYGSHSTDIKTLLEKHTAIELCEVLITMHPALKGLDEIKRLLRDRSAQEQSLRALLLGEDLNTPAQGQSRVRNPSWRASQCIEQLFEKRDRASGEGSKCVAQGGVRRKNISDLLETHSAIELCEVLARNNPQLARSAGISDELADKSGTETQLRTFLLGQERCVSHKQGRREVAFRKHRVASLIERFFLIRENESARINVFTELLWQGWLWSGPRGTLVKCPWHAGCSRPGRADVRAWMRIIVPFLRSETYDDPTKLLVFQHLLACRKSVGIENARLANDTPDYSWNQIATRLRQAWLTMSQRACKRNTRKSA